LFDIVLRVDKNTTFQEIRMVHIFFAIACLCSHYAVASEKEQSDKIAKKAYYDKLIAEQVKDPIKRADYEKGYIVLGEGKTIIPYSEISVWVSTGNGFMSFPMDHPIHEELRQK
jgi:hypothetical protein